MICDICGADPTIIGTHLPGCEYAPDLLADEYIERMEVVDAACADIERMGAIIAGDPRPLVRATST